MCKCEMLSVMSICASVVLCCNLVLVTKKERKGAVTCSYRKAQRPRTRCVIIVMFNSYINMRRWFDAWWGRNFDYILD